MRIPTKVAALLTALVAAGGLAALPASAAPAGPAGNGGHGGRAAACERQLLATNAAFDRAFDARDLDAFMSFYAEDATIIFFNSTRPNTKEEARASNARLFTLDFTLTFDVLKKSIQGCRSAQVVEKGTLTLNGTTTQFLIGLSWVREHGRWRVALDQSTRLPA